MQKLDPNRQPVGYKAAPLQEAIRFKAYQSLSFPASSIYEIVPASEAMPVPAMTVTFLGLTGPSGVLPRHYTELLLRLEKDAKWQDKHALRDWFDLFNHRIIALFYRAWEKYRFHIQYEQGRHEAAEPDPFTLALHSFVGLGTPALRNRLRVAVREVVDLRPRERPLARIDDLVLLYYSGLLSHRPRSAIGLEAILRDYFQLPVTIRQFQGQWLRLGPENQSRMGFPGNNNALGMNLVAGEQVWDVQCKFRIRLGPLRYHQFLDFLPDRAPISERKAFYLLAHLVRLYVGPEFDFDVQLILDKDDVPECQLIATDGIGPRLGWNTWLRSGPMSQDAEQAVFDGEEPVLLNAWA
jgi:type VI secretion system protein ImpH